MSTGEEAFLFQFANIHHTLKNPSFSLFGKCSLDNIVMLIDEGETTFHPQWQKKYLSYLIYFLSKNFSKQKFHLILTSHSPFLLSDIPIQNIIFLDKDKQGNCKVVDGLKDKKQTFGANIHTLLSDSFFMEDGLMGEFAKNKINEIINFHKEVEKEGETSVLITEYKEKRIRFWDIKQVVGDGYLQQVLENHLIEIDKKLLGIDRAKELKIERVEEELKRLKDG
jgi:predicted ATP-binding protein involved in virulence